MRTTKEITSSLNISTILILVIGGVLSTTLGIKLLIDGIEKHPLLIVGVPFFAFGLYCLYCVLNYDILIISNGKLTIKSIIGRTKKTISLSEFKSFTEIEKENAKFRGEAGHMKWKDLTLNGDNLSYKISSTSYSNYNELRKGLIKGLKRNKKAEKKWKRNLQTNWGIGFIIFGVLIGFWFWEASKDNPTEELISVLMALFFSIYGIYLILKTKKASR